MKDLYLQVLRIQRDSVDERELEMVASLLRAAGYRFTTSSEPHGVEAGKAAEKKLGLDPKPMLFSRSGEIEVPIYQGKDCFALFYVYEGKIAPSVEPATPPPLPELRREALTRNSPRRALHGHDAAFGMLALAGKVPTPVALFYRASQALRHFLPKSGPTPYTRLDDVLQILTAFSLKTLFPEKADISSLSAQLTSFGQAVLPSLLAAYEKIPPPERVLDLAISSAGDSHLHSFPRRDVRLEDHNVQLSFFEREKRRHFDRLAGAETGPHIPGLLSMPPRRLEGHEKI